MNTEFEIFMDWVFGGKSLGYYAAALLFSMAGITLSLYRSSRRRDKSSKNTPEKFSWLFLFWDNMIRAFVSLIVMFIIFRSLEINQVLWMVGVGFLVSLSLDQIIDLLEQRSRIIKDMLKMPRDKYPKKSE